MKIDTVKFNQLFTIISENTRSQAASMVLNPGKSEGGPDNCHQGSDQWLFVVSGRGKAIVEGKAHTLNANTLLLIERGKTHEIKNTGRSKLKTLNFYVPPAYTKSGDERPSGKCS